ncbi:heterokaryon incompatibility protein-domain-containing protein [Podospora didyma]|uniref:Heterokaryon incompatibility protein-domain-containing protein n=1 Tax=Podospora didyma TaxID=330526 RepID=A0AAE0TZP6_9PEZI|nr:heterokaryon incompatibility protein-domain-containing protein [Podospora didyma]
MDYLWPGYFIGAYASMEEDLEQRSKNDSLCEYCIQLGIATMFQPQIEGHAEIKQEHGLLSSIASRTRCPFCKLLCQFLRPGGEQYRHGEWDGVVTITLVPQPHRRVGVVHVSSPGAGFNGGYLFAHGHVHFVHPRQADYFRIREWITVCEEGHESCNEELEGGSSAVLFGHSQFSLRLIDVELRRIVQSSHPVRYLTLSYVWGNMANRTFSMAPDPGKGGLFLPPGITSFDQQPEDLVARRLPRTFEDLIIFAQRIRERYIWIDALCIPQHEPAVLVDQIAKMDQIYFHSVCNVVSLSSGVDTGLPGASCDTERHTILHHERLPDGSKISTPIPELSQVIPYTSWATRGWCLQEHQLTRRSIFFGVQEVTYVCKGMSMKESWTRPRTAKDVSSPSDRWSEYDIPLVSGKRADGLTDDLRKLVHMYTTRSLSFASDRHRAFWGLEARLSETYEVKFRYAMPMSAEHLPRLLLWGRLNEAGSSFSAISHTGWPSWSWLAFPGAVTYQNWDSRSWLDRHDFPTLSGLVLPRPELDIQGLGGDFERPGNGSSTLTDAASPSIIRIRGLALDINITQWQNRRHLANALTLWEKHDFPTARGNITFNLGMVADGSTDDDNHGFPEGTTTIRLLHVSHLDGHKPKLPLLWIGNNPAQRIAPSPSGETELSSKIDWVEPDATPNNNCLGLEPDIALLIVEANDEPGAVVTRLGVVYTRIMDFLVAGAAVKEVLLK